MWLKGQCGSTFGLWSGEPGRGLSGATTRTRYWSPSSAGIGMVGGRAVLAAQVVTFDMSGSGAVIGVGAALRTCTDVEGRKLERGELAQWNDTARCRRGWGCGWKGCRDGLR